MENPPSTNPCEEDQNNLHDSYNYGLLSHWMPQRGISETHEQSLKKMAFARMAPPNGPLPATALGSALGEQAALAYGRGDRSARMYTHVLKQGGFAVRSPLDHERISRIPPDRGWYDVPRIIHEED